MRDRALLSELQREWDGLGGRLRAAEPAFRRGGPPFPMTGPGLFSELEEVLALWRELRRAGLSRHARRYVNAGWTLQDLLAHLASWAAEFRRQVETIAAGRDFDYAIPFALSVIGPNAWNEEQVEARRGLSLKAVLDQFEDETRRLQGLVLTLPRVEGVRTFFAPDARIDAKPGGRYEVIFEPDRDPEGADHGTKGSRLLRLVPGKEIAFEWSMPPLGLNQHPLATWLELKLEPAPGRPGRTRLHFAHYGLRSGGNWDKAFSFFRDGNWPLVLNRLVVYCRDKVSPAWKAEPAGDPLDRILVKRQTVAAPLAEVWKAWTTEEGLKTFFAPAAKVQAVPDGPFEIYFNPAAPEGEKGAEGSKVLAVEPMRLFAFDWGAPPTMPNVRKQRTNVIVQLEETGPAETLVRFTSIGWGTGDEWRKAHAYFDKAWDYVLANLARRFAEGPIDWSKR